MYGSSPFISERVVVYICARLRSDRGAAEGTTTLGMGEIAGYGRSDICKQYANDTQARSAPFEKGFAGFAIKRKHGASIATMLFYYITDRVLASEASFMFGKR